MMELTIPLMKMYADRIKADFIEIKERKFPTFHPVYEKLQIYSLGKGCDWNIFFDGDLLVNPAFFDDITKLDPDRVYLKDGYKADIKFKIKLEGNQGIAACFVASSKSCHNIWKPLNMTSEEAISEIIIGDKDKLSPTNNAQDELALSMNLAKYHIKFSGVNQKYLFHPYESVSNEEKLKQIKTKLKEWRLL